MKCFIALGSNRGDRRALLEQAAAVLNQDQNFHFLRASPVFETPALIPPGGPETWRIPFLNAVVEITWSGSPRDLLALLKNTERILGREPSERWSPRLIDLDLLTFGDHVIDDADFHVPHREIWNRQFVLEPLKHLQPSLRIPGHDGTVLQRSRGLWSKATLPTPLWMGILNLTPDSFSDKESLQETEIFKTRLESFDADGTHILDLGAESTRPGASVVSPHEEWRRLLRAIETIRQKYDGRFFKPLLSIDTHHAETAEKALALGADIINDVGGLNDPKMRDVIAAADCQYVLMHSLSVPADTRITLKNENVVVFLKNWALEKLETLEKSGISSDRVVFDPGIGFGKTPQQSLTILRQVEHLLDLPVRILIGHSNKSFLNQWSERKPAARDFETLGVSLALANKGVDILRVHSPDLHQRTLRTFREIS